MGLTSRFWSWSSGLSKSILSLSSLNASKDLVSFELQHMLDGDTKIHDNHIKFLYYNK